MAEFGTILQPGAPIAPLTGNAPLPGNTGQGAIQGGLLRPGSIDQTRFQHLLQAEQQAREAAASGAGTGMTLDDYRKLAGAPTSTAPPLPTPGGPVALSATAPSDGIPSLTSEQFAVLAGMSETPPVPASVFTPATAMPFDATAAGTPLTGTPLTGTDTIPDESDIDDMRPRDGLPDQLASETTEGDAAVADTAPTNSRVVWFDTMPDRDERRALQAAGKQWRQRETPGARELFLGPDGKFGWDDLLDIVNPLQHIPVVAQVYRAVTGDQAYGLSQFLGAAPFGPLSVANAVIDTIVRAQTGRDAGTDLAAAILGIDNRTPEEANLHLVAPPPQLVATRASSPAANPATSDAAPAVLPAAWTRESSGLAGGMA